MVAKARTGTISQRGENRWRLQVTPEPDPLTGPRRRLSETIIGTRREADRALQHLIEAAGARLAQEANTVATILDRSIGCRVSAQGRGRDRRGEICALPWSDIDLDLRSVRIERSVNVMLKGAYQAGDTIVVDANPDDGLVSSTRPPPRSSTD